MKADSLVPPRFSSWLMLLALLGGGCAKAPGQPAPAAETPKVESDLSRTNLSKSAARSLSIQSQTVRNRQVQEQLPLTGWVMVKQGNEVTLTAPVGGYVLPSSQVATTGRPSPVAGLTVQKDQELFALQPVLTPVEQIQIAALKRSVENELAKARESVLVADLELKRVLELHSQKLRGQQEVEQARARLSHAREDLAAAEDKLKLFAESAPGDTHLKLTPVRAPRAGTVLTVHVSPGQYVPAAAPLVTLADLSEMWLRVPVPETDLPRVDRKHPATVALKPGKATGGAAPPAKPLQVQPVALVPQVDLARHTADLIYAFPANAADHGILAKDQMVTVHIPLGTRREESVVPYSAVIFDAYAGAWIYLDLTTDKSPKHVYERRRVELGPMINDEVVIRPGLKAGERVVTTGAAAIFSREFHKTPVGAAAADLDDD